MKELIIYNIIAAALVGSILIPLAAAYNSNQIPKETIYLAASEGGDKLRLVLSEGLNINSIDKEGNTALMTAAAGNRTDLVNLLVNNGACVNIQNESGKTALIIAAEKGFTEVACILLDAEADPHIRDRSGKTALEKAEAAGHHETAGFIGRYGG